MQPSTSVQGTTDPSPVKLGNEDESSEKHENMVFMSKNQMKKQRRVKW